MSGRTAPLSSAAAIVNGFSVEPGSNTSVSARLRILSRATLLRAFGLYVGQLASARISPLCASRITSPPAFARFASTAAFNSRNARYWRRASIASARSRPACGARMRLDVLDDFAAAVDDHAPAAGLAAEPFLLRELDAFLPDVVVAGEADDVARHLACRIEAPVLVLVVHAFDLERRDAFRDFRRHLLREKDEVVAFLELLRERARRRLERLRELRELRPAWRRPGRETPRPISRASRSRAARRRDRRCGRDARAPRSRGCSGSSPAPAGTRC